MSPAALGLVLTAAVLHAVWNLAAKNSRGDSTIFVWLYFTIAAVICVPLGAAELVISGGSVGWELLLGPVVSAVLHIAYSTLLQTGYSKADLSVVYPVSRGVGPLLTVIIAVLLLGERPETAAIIGGLIVIGGILVVTGRQLFRRSAGLSTGLGYGVATGVAISSYTLWDNFSVNDLGISPLIYFGVAGVFQSAMMLPWVLRKRAQIKPTWRSDKREVLIVAVLSPAAYVLVLYAMLTTSVALVAPVRESSIVIGALLAWWLFKEPHPVRRILGAAVVAGGIALIALS